jgi:phage terminase large subunit-like protein
MTPTSWWGEGPEPTTRWPGAVREIPAVWSSAQSRWESPDGTFAFDEAAASKAEGFFPKFLRHPMGPLAGTPFTLRADQRYLVRALSGWKSTQTGRRRFSKVFVALPKGNGKSMFVSGLSLYYTFFDGEAGPEGHVVAGDRLQARIVFDAIKVLINQHPKLASHFTVLRDRVTKRGAPSDYIQVLSSDAPTKHGLRPHVIAFDEFHVQPDRELFDTLVRGLGKRAQPILLMITTAGSDLESICFEEWELARRVIRGDVADDRVLPFVLELAADEDWTDLDNIKRVNPGFGTSIRADYFVDEIAAAQVEPRKRNSFLQLHCNRWTNQATSWIPIEWWDACDAPLPDDDVLRTLPVAAGLDMAQKVDLTAFVLVFRQRVDLPTIDAEAVTGDKGNIQTLAVSLNYRIIVLPFFWLPEDTLQRHEQDEGVDYSEWRRLGLLRVTPGSIIDYSRIVGDITTSIMPRFPKLKLVGYDRAFATDVAQNLERAGLQPVEVLQNYSHLTEPCYVFEALVRANRVVHGGQRVLRQHVATVAVKQDGVGRMMPVKPKQRSARQHIDGVVATLMGLKAVATMPDRSEPKYLYGIYGPSAVAS